MKYSFIIPVYNCKAYLRGCVESVLSTSLQDMEILLVDDGSTDGSGTVCDALSKRNRQVCVLHQKNQGVSAARNHGLRRAAGEYVVFLDADDWIEPENLRAVLQIMAADETIDMAVYGVSLDDYDRGRCFRRVPLCPPVAGKLDSSQWIPHMPELFAANSLSPVWNKVFKRSILLENRLEFSQEMFLYEDLEYSLRCMACCDMIYFSTDVGYHHRRWENGENAGRRLRGIGHLPELMAPIETAMNWLTTKHQGQELMNSILLKLYLILLREKIRVSGPREIRTAGDDWNFWLAAHPCGMESILTKPDQRYLALIKEKKVFRLMLIRTMAAVRHRVSVYWKKHKASIQIRK